MEEYHAIFAERMIQLPGGAANLQTVTTAAAVYATAIEDIKNPR